MFLCVCFTIFQARLQQQQQQQQQFVWRSDRDKREVRVSQCLWRLFNTNWKCNIKIQLTKQFCTSSSTQSTLESDIIKTILLVKRTLGELIEACKCYSGAPFVFYLFNFLASQKPITVSVLLFICIVCCQQYLCKGISVLLWREWILLCIPISSSLWQFPGLNWPLCLMQWSYFRMSD